MTTAQINTINRNKSAQLNFIYVDTTNHQYPIYYIGLQDGTLKQQTTTSASIGAITPLSIVSLSPLFTASVNTTSVSQDILFAQIPQAANTFYGGPTSGASANPTFRILTTADLPVGTGTVTSFSAGNLSPLFTTSVATPTTTPALTFTLNTQTANTVFAGPSTGVATTPTFRSLVLADIPSLSSLYWNLNGNTVGSEKFIGTLDAYSFPFRINNGEVGRFLYSATASINGNFGINQTSPSAKLHIKGYDTTSSFYSLKVDDSSSNPLLYIQNNGDVGIGYATPTARCYIKGSGTSSAAYALGVYNSTPTHIFSARNDGAMQFGSPTYVGSTNWNFVSTAFTGGGTNGMTITHSGDYAFQVFGSNVAAYIDCTGSTGLQIGTGKLWVQNDNIIVATTNITPTARIHIVGTGTTSATFGLKIYDSTTTSLVFSIRDDGAINTSTSINTTAGDSATMNVASGRFRKDTTGSTFTLTNSLITANSIILLTLVTAGLTTGNQLSVVAGAGSATITFETAGVAAAPSANADVNFFIIN